MPAASLTTRAPARPFRSKRLLALASDERLVDQIRRGNEAAFEVAFERYGAGILAFCRHMLGSREEAEDAVQHTFAAAYSDLQRDGERRIMLRPWLYTIARNRCLSLLRARREQSVELEEVPTDGLSDEVERRAELRDLLRDVRELPEDQRAALLLSEAAGMSHAEVAQVLGCETGRVKGLVFRARSGLIERREARLTPCSEIREQLATLRGGALRRNELRHHLRRCPGCSAYRDELRHQRQLLAAALPVVPSLGLKSSVLAAAGIGGGAAGGGAAAGGLAALGSFGSGVVTKAVVVGALATGGVAAGGVVVERVDDRTPEATVMPERGASGDRDGTSAGTALGGEAGQGERISAERSHGQRGLEQRSERSRGRGPTSLAGPDRVRAKVEKPAMDPREGGRAFGREKRAGAVESAPRVKTPPAGRDSPPRAERKPAPGPKAPVEPKARAKAPVSDPYVAPAPEPVPAPNAPATENVQPVE